MAEKFVAQSSIIVDIKPFPERLIGVKLRSRNGCSDPGDAVIQAVGYHPTLKTFVYTIRTWVWGNEATLTIEEVRSFYSLRDSKHGTALTNWHRETLPQYLSTGN